MPKIGNKNALRHGGVGSSTYVVWMAMKARCDNPNRKDFANYGGRGIGYCEAWKSFEAFRRDMGERPDGLTLDRINNNAGYSPENCRWVTMSRQHRNTRRTRMVTAFGETKSLADWADAKGIRQDTLARRLSRGLSAEEALSRPVQIHRSRPAS